MRLLVELGKEVARELAQAFATHVGNVDVAHAAIRLFAHIVDVVLHPVVVLQRILIGDGLHHNLACSGAVGRRGDGEFGEHVGLAAQQRVDVVHPCGAHAVNGGDKVALAHVHSLHGKWRAEFLAVGRALPNLDNAVGVAFARQLCAQQAHGKLVDFDVVATVHIGMTASQFANHLAYHIGEVQAVLHIGQQHGILVVHGFPVHAVHVLQVETVAIGAPSLIEDLGPLLLVVHLCHHVVEIDGLAEFYLVFGRCHHIGVLSFDKQCLAAVGRDHHASAARNQVVFLFFEVKHVRAVGAVIPHVLAVAEERAVTAGGHGEFDDAVGEAVDVDAVDARGRRLRLALLVFAARFAFALIVAAFLAGCHLGIGGQEGRRRFFVEQREVDAFGLAIGKIPLD